MTTAIGLSIGSGMYYTGIFTTVLVIVIQVIFHRVHIGGDTSTYTVKVIMEESAARRSPTGGRTETESYESIGGKGRKNGGRPVGGGASDHHVAALKPGGGGGDSEKESGDFLHIALSRQQNNKAIKITFLSDAVRRFILMVFMFITANVQYYLIDKN